MKIVLIEKPDYDIYYEDNSPLIYGFHRINGPVMIRYRTQSRKEIMYKTYSMFGKSFYPWWLRCPY